MKYAVQRGDGSYTGVAYDQPKPNITAHHAQYGETLVPVAALTNTGSDDDAVWEVVEPDAEDYRAAMTVSRMQAKLALLEAGRLDEIDAVMSEAPPDVQIAWQEATEFQRNSPTIAALNDALDPPMSDEELDALFEAAAQKSA